MTDVPSTGVPTVSAGVTAVGVALGMVGREMGLVRGAQGLLALNQVHGIDCPGCAWPEPAERARFEFCENGAKHLAHEATRDVVTADLFRQRSIRDLARESDRWLEGQGRLIEPVLRRRGSDHFEAVSWPEAFAHIGRVLRELGPAATAFYTSGRTSNEAAFLWQLLARRFGTNNLPDCSNLCHESSGKALSATLGVSKGTVQLSDFEKADLILVVGQNPGTNHPRMLATLEAAARRGCHIVSINPLAEVGLVRFKHPQHVRGILGRGTPIASDFVRVRINGDVALFQALSKAVLEREAWQPDFIDASTSGFAAFREHSLGLSWEVLVAESGVPRTQIEALAERYLQSRAVIACWAMGLTQHENAVANIQELVNLLLLRGHVGRPGAGLCPVRGHSNVQGDRTMGITPTPRPAFLDRLRDAFDFEPPRAPGLDVVDTIRALREGRVRALLSMGGNFLAASPDTTATAAALTSARLTVQVLTKLNRTAVTPGEEALLLPCLGRSDDDRGRFVSVENSMGFVHTSRGSLTPPGRTDLAPVPSEPELVCALASALLSAEERLPWRHWAQDYDAIRDAIAACVPGFQDMNARLRAPEHGFLLPNAAREGRFETADGRALFTTHPTPTLALADDELLLMTIRTHDQYNTTVYSDDDRYRGIHGERRVVLVNVADLERLGLTAGQWVDIVGRFRGEERVAERFVLIPYDIPERCAAAYFPETNALVPLDHVARVSNTPASKSLIVALRPR